MRLIIVFQLFLLAPLPSKTQSEANRQRSTCEAKDPYKKGFLVYSELLLATVKEQMHRQKEEHNQNQSMKTAKDNCIELKENLEEEIRNLSKAKEDLEKKRESMERVVALQKKDINTIKESFENPFDCADIQILKSRKSGIHKIRPNRTGEYVDVYCDLDKTKNGGGWTVFLNRQVETTPISFNRTWQDYKEGFGNKNSEFWLGNDLLHTLTTSDGSPLTLRVDAEDFYGESGWAEWNIFTVDDKEHKYRLTLKEYQEASTLGDGLSVNDGSPFSTVDADNDNCPGCNCANHGSSVVLTGGWWYNSCGNVRPTFIIKNTSKFLTSSFWEPWVNGHWRNLQKISMKFRRRNYKKLASPKKKNINN